MTVTTTERITPPGPTISARRLLPAVLGLITLLVLLPIMAAGYYGARDNTRRLLQATSDAVLDGLEDQLRTTIAPVADQMAQAARYVAAGRVSPDDRDAFRRFMLGVVTGQSNVIGIGFLEAEGPFRRWTRDSGEEVVEPRSSAPFADEIWRSAMAGEGPRWHEPFASVIARTPVLLHRQPVFRQGRLLGVFMTALTSEAISDYVQSMNKAITPFVLIGRETVILHPNMRNTDLMGRGLPRIDQVGDHALAIMWQDPRRPFFEPVDNARSKTHWSWTGEGYQAVQYYFREVEGYGPSTWVVGFHQDSRATMRERWVVVALLYGSGAALVLILIAAWRVGWLAARPAAAIAEVARKLERLDFDGVQNARLEGSRISEVRDTFHALSRAALALKRVQTYVPRVLIARLVKMGDDRPTATDSEVTILFADLAGYTGFSHGRSAAEVARYLNDIFAEIGPIIERHGGTIDKYTGDGLLAVWGTPTADASHAANAWAAAREIRDGLCNGFRRRLDEDSRACRLRLGLHSGRVLAGDLGFEGRTDFTVVGRTVNIAQRTQNALKGHMGDDPIAIALTGATKTLVGLPDEAVIVIGETGDETVYKVL